MSRSPCRNFCTSIMQMSCMSVLARHIGKVHFMCCIILGWSLDSSSRVRFLVPTSAGLSEHSLPVVWPSSPTFPKCILHFWLLMQYLELHTCNITMFTSSIASSRWLTTSRNSLAAGWTCGFSFSPSGNSHSALFATQSPFSSWWPPAGCMAVHPHASATCATSAALASSSLSESKMPCTILYSFSLQSIEW